MKLSITSAQLALIKIQNLQCYSILYNLGPRFFTTLGQIVQQEKAFIVILQVKSAAKN